MEFLIKKSQSFGVPSTLWRAASCALHDHTGHITETLRCVQSVYLAVIQVKHKEYAGYCRRVWGRMQLTGMVLIVAVGEQWVCNDHYWGTESPELLSKCLQTVLDITLFSHTETKDGKTISYSHGLYFLDLWGPQEHIPAPYTWRLDCVETRLIIYKSTAAKNGTTVYVSPFLLHEIGKGSGQSSCIHEAMETVQSQDLGTLVAMRTEGRH